MMEAWAQSQRNRSQIGIESLGTHMSRRNGPRVHDYARKSVERIANEEGCWESILGGN